MGTEAIVGTGMGGAIAVILVKFLMDFVRHQQRTIENHIKHQTEATQEAIAALRDVKEAINNNGKAFQAFQQWVMSQQQARH